MLLCPKNALKTWCSFVDKDAACLLFHLKIKLCNSTCYLSTIQLF